MANDSTTPESLQLQTKQQNCKKKGFDKLLKCPYHETLLILYVNFTRLSDQFESFKKSCFLEQNGPDVVCMSISNGSDSFPNLNKKKYHYILFSENQTSKTGISNNNVAMYEYIKSNISCRKHEDLIQHNLQVALISRSTYLTQETEK